MNEINKIQKNLVTESHRPEFLYKQLGASSYAFENTVYRILSNICDKYNGGYWDFFSLSSGGFFMAPNDSNMHYLSMNGNEFEGYFSSEAAGIVATLYALNNLCWLESDGVDGNELLNNKYYWLRDYACGHTEKEHILSAID